MEADAKQVAVRPVGPSLWSSPSQWQWWLIVALGLALYLVFRVITDVQTRDTFWYVLGQTPEDLLNGRLVFKGIAITLTVAISAYLFAMVLGLILGLMRTSDNPILNNIGSLYVEIIRGVPMLVLLLYVTFALTGLFVGALQSIGIPITTRNIPFELRAMIALGLGYASFEAEIFRAGIQSIERGQHEASSALGLTYLQKMRFIVLPQAIRRILPALGNDFISMVKDSSLVSFLGVQDMTQLAKLYYSGNFLYMQTLTLLAFIYLLIVVVLTRLLRLMEQRLQRVYVR